MITYAGLFLLSAATLVFEINLTRVFSVAQFYHFAFMIVSLALLGFGASGTFLALFPRLKERDPTRVLPLLGWGFVIAAVGSYVFTLYVPFDSFRIAHDWRQGAVLALHYVALATPFFCSGTAVGLLLAAHPEVANRTYAANLTGSAAGCLLAVVAPPLMGGEGTVLLSAALGLLAVLTFQHPASSVRHHDSRFTFRVLRFIQAALVLVLLVAALAPPSFLQIRLSPYKSLSYALLYPDAELVSRRWNGFSRVDAVRSASIRSLPGRGFVCPGQPPPQLGLTVDGDDLSPISHVAPGFTALDFTDCLLTALPYRLRAGSNALVLEPRGGFDVLVALAEGARAVTAVEANPLIVEAVRAQGEWAGRLYDDPRVTVVVEEGRAYARRARAASLPFTRERAASLPFTRERAASLPFTRERAASLPFTRARAASLPFTRERAASLPFTRARAASLPFTRERAASLPFTRARAASLPFTRERAASLPFTRARAASLPFTREQERYDVVMLSLTAPQRPVTSGAYSLAEDYRYTVQAFGDYLARLDEDGLLVVTRWLQVPPSEAIRAFALSVEAVERAGGDPRTSIVALRSYQQMLILARRSPFTGEELEAVRAFAAPRAFDLVYLPDIRSDEVNRYNVMPEPDYYRACVGLLEAEDRDGWYRAYPFDVEPPDDDHPFFGHFFKWGQASQVLAMAGHTWQPFGGAGYFVLLALLALALLAAGVLILLPLAVRGGGGMARRESLAATLGYFALLGLGYLCVEIPLLQRFILFLGHPAYAMATVLFALLLFSGLGSLLSRRVELWLVLILLPLLVGGYAVGLPALFEATLAAPLEARLVIAVAALAPPGLLMGIPFPKGLALLERESPVLIAWAWGVNGAVSVVASILAALLALSFGFSAVLVVGAACYLGAWAMARAIRIPLRHRAPPPPAR